VQRAAKAVGIGIVALAVVALLIVLLFRQQTENSRIGCAFRGMTLAGHECVTTTTRN